MFERCDCEEKDNGDGGENWGTDFGLKRQSSESDYRRENDYADVGCSEPEGESYSEKTDDMAESFGGVEAADGAGFTGAGDCEREKHSGGDACGRSDEERGHKCRMDGDGFSCDPRQAGDVRNRPKEKTDFAEEGEFQNRCDGKNDEDDERI